MRRDAFLPLTFGFTVVCFQKRSGSREFFPRFGRATPMRGSPGRAGRRSRGWGLRFSRPWRRLAWTPRGMHCSRPFFPCPKGPFLCSTCEARGSALTFSDDFLGITNQGNRFEPARLSSARKMVLEALTCRSFLRDYAEGFSGWKFCTSGVL